MAYFKVGTTDLSNYVSDLKVEEQHNYSSQTNASGDTRVDYINSKRSITVTFIASNATTVTSILSGISFQNSISFLSPKTNTLVTNVSTICDKNNLEYYTIQSSNTILKAFTLTFKEL